MSPAIVCSNLVHVWERTLYHTYGVDPLPDIIVVYIWWTLYQIWGGGLLPNIVVVSERTLYWILCGSDPLPDTLVCVCVCGDASYCLLIHKISSLNETMVPFMLAILIVFERELHSASTLPL